MMMGASAAEHDESKPLARTCHICGDVVDSEVWYARTRASEGGPRRIYACPECYFDLSDEDRETYYRERV